MNVFLGVDLGSTTSKAVIVDSSGDIIGRGITNTRSNYEVAAQIAQDEAEFNSRFTLLHRKLKSESNDAVDWDSLINQLENRFHYLQYQYRYNRLMDVMFENAAQLEDKDLSKVATTLLNKYKESMLLEVKEKFLSSTISSSSEFFRDLFSASYMSTLQNEYKDYYDQLVALYDRSITPVENEKLNFDFSDLAEQAVELLPEDSYQREDSFRKNLEDIESFSLEPSDYIGTGYGRQLLPFEEIHIKSEILCHAMGAHAIFPETRTVLDIGGQDTKAIQVDKYGLVTSFQMNDRCAAGCGRYLGYIADEMSISVGELGPMAMKADHEANICSTCTVFAGAELREYLNLGEKKENILAGLHKAIVQRAFGLLARSGGVRNEFTFTGGVARNQAVVKYVSQMVEQNYGKLTINCHTDSIFMGALGAALFSARRK